MQAHEHLTIVEACRDLVLRSAAAVDTNDARRVADLFVEDGELVRPNGETMRGRDAIRASYAERPADRITRHLIANVIVDVESASAASSVSCVLLWSASNRDAETPQGRPCRRQQVGEFRDRFLHTEAGWRIARREARFILWRDA